MVMQAVHQERDALEVLLERIRAREARVGVIGLGYVGLPLATEFAKSGLQVTGIDTDPGRVDQINRGVSYIGDVDSSEITALVETERLRASSDFSAIDGLDTINICVPTPLRKTKDPDLTFVIGAVDAVSRHLHRGQLVVLESTTYPGTTEELVLPALEKSGLRVGKDFFLAFSPERIDPGNRIYTTRNIPKVVGGVTPRCTLATRVLYEQCVERVIPVLSPRTAEMVKLLENTFRSVNIALVNELALMCRHLHVDVWEVIDAAATKPFGFMSFLPGPGLGGHCIPIDPYYLSWKAKMNGFEPRFIELAGHVNESMPRFVVQRIADALNQCERSVRGSRIHILGVAYKKNVSDVRESPALVVMKLLIDKGATVSYTDPFVPQVQEKGMALRSVDLDLALASGVDCAVILTDHDDVDYRTAARLAPLIVDTRNVLRGFVGDNIVRL